MANFLNISKCCILLLIVGPYLWGQDQEAFVTNASNGRPLHCDINHVFGEGIETKIPHIVETDFVFVFRAVPEWPTNYTYIGCFRYAPNGEHVQWFYETNSAGSFNLMNSAPARGQTNAIFAFDTDPAVSNRHYIATAVSKLWFNLVPGSDRSNPSVIDASAPSVLRFKRDQIPRIVLGTGFDIYWRDAGVDQELIDPNGPVPVWALPPTPPAPHPYHPPSPSRTEPRPPIPSIFGRGPEVRQFCRPDVPPSGWVILGYIPCANGGEGPQAENTAGMKKGDRLTICASSPIPQGWKDVGSTIGSVNCLQAPVGVGPPPPDANNGRIIEKQ